VALGIPVLFAQIGRSNGRRQESFDPSKSLPKFLSYSLHQPVCIGFISGKRAEVLRYFKSRLGRIHTFEIASGEYLEIFAPSWNLFSHAPYIRLVSHLFRASKSRLSPLSSIFWGKRELDGNENIGLKFWLNNLLSYSTGTHVTRLVLFPNLGIVGGTITIHYANLVDSSFLLSSKRRHNSRTPMEIPYPYYQSSGSLPPLPSFAVDTMVGVVNGEPWSIHPRPE